MSLILDAIKKSERERQQQEIPGLGANHSDYQNQPQKSNRWRWILALIISVLLLAYFVGFKDIFSDNILPQQVPIKTEPPSQKESTETDLEIPKATTVQQSGPEIDLQETQLDSSSKTQTVKTKNIQSETMASAETQQIINLDQQLIKQLPSIDFSSHVYTGDSSTSFVVLNDELLGVGEFFNDDIKIIQITKEGIVISFNDQQIFIKVLEKINL